MLCNLQSRAFRKNMATGHYNLRFRPSHGRDNIYVGQHSNVVGTMAEPSQTNRDPTSHPFSNNMFRNDYWEWRMRAGDYLYQIGHRLHRSNDGWSRTLAAWSAFSFMMAGQALIWKIHFGFFTMCLLTRIRDKGAEPTIDEINVLDQVF
jgi:hypothetical protein